MEVAEVACQLSVVGIHRRTVSFDFRSQHFYSPAPHFIHRRGQVGIVGEALRLSPHLMDTTSFTCTLYPHNLHNAKARELLQHHCSFPTVVATATTKTTSASPSSSSQTRGTQHPTDVKPVTPDSFLLRQRLRHPYRHSRRRCEHCNRERGSRSAATTASLCCYPSQTHNGHRPTKREFSED